MLDLRPVGYLIGLLVGSLGLTMLLPMAVDLYDGDAHWSAFFFSGLISFLVGGLFFFYVK